MLEFNQSFASNLTREYAIACGKNPLKKFDSLLKEFVKKSLKLLRLTQ